MSFSPANPGTRDLKPGVSRRGAYLDGLAIFLLLLVGLAMWPRLAVEDTFYINSAIPFWATPADLVLDGPDAGEWAVAASQVRDGRPGDVDLHRMPTWPSVTALVLAWEDDVALAGHLVNHVSHLLLPLVLYLLGRSMGGPAVGMAAALMGASCPELWEASRRYGVDPLVALMLPLSLLLPTMKGRAWALPAGLVAAGASLCHYTSIPYLFPTLLLVLLYSDGLLSALSRLLLFLLGVAMLSVPVAMMFHLPSVDGLWRSLSEGVAPGAASGVGTGGLSPAAMSTFRAGLGGAMERAVGTVTVALRPWFLPWWLALALPWLGVLGVGLGRAGVDSAPRSRRESSGRRAGRAGRTHRATPEVHAPTMRGSIEDWNVVEWLRTTDLRCGVVLLACLVPLPLLAAAGAPERYSYNLLPFVILLWSRAAASIGAGAEWLVFRMAGLRGKGLLAALPCLLLGLGTVKENWSHRAPLAPRARDLAVREMGLSMREFFPGGGGAVCPVREINAFAGRALCPLMPCPFRADQVAYEDCLDLVARECKGEGPIPYVVVEKDSELEIGTLRRAMDEWILERASVLTTVHSGGLLAHLLAVPRERPVQELLENQRQEDRNEPGNERD